MTFSKTCTAAHLLDITEAITNQILFNRPNIQQISLSEFSNIFDTQSENASAKISLHIDVGIIRFNDNNPHKYIDWYKIPNYSLQVVHAGFVLRPNNFFFDVLDQTVQKLISTGLMYYIVNNCTLFQPKRNIPTNPSIFSLENLSFGFVIWSGCYVLCCVAFIIEMVVWKVSIRTRLVTQKNNMLNQNKIKYKEDVQKEIRQLVRTIISYVDENMRK
jgi:hypothetical protein